MPDAAQRFQFRKGAAVVGVEQIFTTPLLSRMLKIATPEFLERLKQEILALEKLDSGVKVSNFGGWHSKTDLFERESETIAALREAALGAAAEMTYEQIKNRYPTCQVTVKLHGGSWANVSRAGDYNKVHNHPGAVWSGAFYVALGNRDKEPAGNGCIEFVDPRPGNHHAFKVVVDPKPGQLLIFPSWLYHYVNPFRGTGERISIAFNTVAEVNPAKEG
jgi:uncharacterized protein (TIGR02466 family)